MLYKFWRLCDTRSRDHAIKVSRLNWSYLSFFIILTSFKDAQRVAEYSGLSDETPVENGAMTPQVPFDSAFPLDLSQFNPYGADSLSDAWFSQHIINLDGMNFGQMYP